MKVSIITEGTQQTGYGHITRCLSIYQAFESRNIIPTIYINGDQNCETFLQGAKFEIINWLNNPDSLFSELSRSDVIIVDSYLAPKEVYERVSHVTQMPLFIDDTLRLEYPGGIILNTAVNADTLGYPAREDQTLLLGAKYALLRKEFWDTFERPHRLDIQTIMITFGGQDSRNLTPRMLRIFARNFPEMKKNIVVGSGFQNLDDILAAKDINTDIHMQPTAMEMLKIMYDSDIAISAGGQTIFELARVGLPTIAIAVADNQTNNINSWVKEKFLPSDITYLQPNLENRLLLVFNSMRKKQNRETVSKIGKLKVDGSGAKRVIQFLIEKYAGKTGFYFRKAIDKDSATLFNLANDRLVRANLINQEPVKWSDHLDWFSGKLMDDDCYFLLAYTGSDNLVGQIRFELKNNFAEIYIAIDREFRGKRLSKTLIFNATYKCFQENPNLEYIVAYISALNIAAIKAFSKAGYFLSERILKDGNEVLVYKSSRQ
jgi:UDP-2,4-diacetamido-2,4,6-trideoxy-beta-L-altropyranose hydrolase